MTFQEYVDQLARGTNVPHQDHFDDDGWLISKFKPFYANSPLSRDYDPCYPIGEIFQEVVYYRPEYCNLEVSPYETLEDGTNIYTGNHDGYINYVTQIPAVFGTDQTSSVLSTSENHDTFVKRMAKHYHEPPTQEVFDEIAKPKPLMPSAEKFKKDVTDRLDAQLEECKALIKEIKAQYQKPINFSQFAPGPMPVSNMPNREVRRAMKKQTKKTKNKSKSVEDKTPITVNEMLNAPSKPIDVPAEGDVKIETLMVHDNGAPMLIDSTTISKTAEVSDVDIIEERAPKACSEFDGLPMATMINMAPMPMPFPTPTSLPGQMPTNMWGEPIQQPMPMWNIPPYPPVIYQSQFMPMPAMPINQPLPRVDEYGNPIKYREGNPPIVGKWLGIPDYMRDKLPPYEIPPREGPVYPKTASDPFGVGATPAESPIPKAKPGETITNAYVSDKVINDLAKHGIYVDIEDEDGNKTSTYRPAYERQPAAVDAWGRPIPQYGYTGMNTQPLPINPYAIPQPRPGYQPKVDYYNPFPEYYNTPWQPMYRPFNGGFSPYVSMAQQRDLRAKYIDMQKLRFRIACKGCGMEYSDEAVDEMFNPGCHAPQRTTEEIAEDAHWNDIKRFMYWADHPMPYITTPEESTAMYMQTYSKNFHEAFDNHSLCEFLEEDLPRLMREFWIAENIKKNADRDMRGIYSMNDYNSLLSMHAQSNPYLQKAMQMASLQDSNKPKQKTLEEQLSPMSTDSNNSEDTKYEVAQDYTLGKEFIDMMQKLTDPDFKRLTPPKDFAMPEEVRRRREIFERLVSRQAQEKAEIMFHKGKLITPEEAEMLGPEDHILVMEQPPVDPRTPEELAKIRKESDDLIRANGGVFAE